MPLNFPDTWGVRKDYTEEIKEGDYVEVIDIAPTSKKYEN
jgi:ribosomal protein S17